MIAWVDVNHFHCCEHHAGRECLGNASVIGQRTHKSRVQWHREEKPAQIPMSLKMSSLLRKKPKHTTRRIQMA